MSIDFTIKELSFLSDILNDFSSRNEKYCFLYSSDNEVLCNLINKVDNELSI